MNTAEGFVVGKKDSLNLKISLNGPDDDDDDITYPQEIVETCISDSDSNGSCVSSGEDDDDEWEECYLIPVEPTPDPNLEFLKCDEVMVLENDKEEISEQHGNHNDNNIMKTKIIAPRPVTKLINKSTRNDVGAKKLFDARRVYLNSPSLKMKPNKMIVTKFNAKEIQRISLSSQSTTFTPTATATTSSSSKPSLSIATIMELQKHFYKKNNIINTPTAINATSPTSTSSKPSSVNPINFKDTVKKLQKQPYRKFKKDCEKIRRESLSSDFKILGKLVPLHLFHCQHLKRGSRIDLLIKAQIYLKMLRTTGEMLERENADLKYRNEVLKSKLRLTQIQMSVNREVRFRSDSD